MLPGGGVGLGGADKQDNLVLPNLQPLRLLQPQTMASCICCIMNVHLHLFQGDQKFSITMRDAEIVCELHVELVQGCSKEGNHHVRASKNAHPSLCLDDMHSSVRGLFPPIVF